MPDIVTRKRSPENDNKREVSFEETWSIAVVPDIGVDVDGDSDLIETSRRAGARSAVQPRFELNNGPPEGPEQQGRKF